MVDSLQFPYYTLRISLPITIEDQEADEYKRLLHTTHLAMMMMMILSYKLELRHVYPDSFMW